MKVMTKNLLSKLDFASEKYVKSTSFYLKIVRI